MYKPSSRGAVLRAKPIALAVAALLPAGAAFAQTAPNTVPTNGSYTAGTGTILPVTPENHLRVEQTSQKGIIEWGTFSIGSAASVHFQHDFGRQGVTLNRVMTANSPSEIFGRLSSNGQLFLVNNAGVLFAPSASVSAAAIVASTLSITDQNFLNPTNGKYEFYNPGNAGSVVNQAGMNGAAGSIVTANGYTALIGPQVRNDGIIIANAGKVALGAGDRVSLDIVGDGLLSISVDAGAATASLVNTGTLQADGGTVLLKASRANALLDTVLNTSGIVRANALIEHNGEIVLDAGNSIQVAGTVQAGGSISIAADGALNVGSTVCCISTEVTAGSQTIEAGSITVGGGATVSTTAGAGTQTVTTAGTLLVRGGVLAGDVGFVHDGSGQQRITAGNLELRGGTGTNTGAFINSRAGGDQTVTVAGDLRITGGASGTGNRAGIVSSGNQTIDGKPNIALTGGAGGGAGNASNNVFIQATNPTKTQTIDAASIELRSGTGTDASATLNAARQFISTTGNVSLFGGSGLGGSNGVRIGGIGGTTLGPTNLTLNVGGNLLLHGGSVNGASLGSSGASTQANTITVNAAGNITLESEGAGARIGSSNQAGATPGNISVTAGGSLGLGNGTAVRANGPITLTANSLTNDGTITNGGGANTPNIILSANAFDLTGGNIQGGAGAVVLRPRDGARSLGIEAAGDTTLTNADIASINTSNFVVFGSGTGTIFTGNMTIGQNAQVDGGTKNLAFFRSSAPGGTTTIGSQGVTTSGDAIVSAGGGAIVSNGGTVAGDEVQLRASQGIGSAAARVRTSANALAINNTGGPGAFVSEGGDVTLRSVNLLVGGIANNVSNVVGGGGAYDVAAAGAISVGGLIATTNGAITLTTNSLANSALITTNGPANTANIVFNADAFNLAGGTVQAGAGAVILRPRTGTNSFGIEAAGATTLTNADIASINTSNFVVFGSGMGTTFTGNMTIGQNARVEGGDKNLAFFRSSVPGGTTTIGANGVNTTGNVIVSAGGGAILSNGGTVSGDQVQLRASQGIGSAAARVQTAANRLALNNTGSQGAFVSELNDVTLGNVNLTVGGIVNNVTNTIGGGGTYDLIAGGSVTLADLLQAGSVSLRANGGSIAELGAGAIAADTLTTFSSGGTFLDGANQVASFNGSTAFGAPSGDITLNNTGALTVTGLSAGNNATLTNNGAVSVTGGWFSFGETDIATTGGNLTVLSSLSSGRAMALDVGGTLTVSASGPQTAQLITNNGGQTIRAQAVEVVAQNGGFASITNIAGGEQRITVSGEGTSAGLDVHTRSSGGRAEIFQQAGGFAQTIEVTNADHVNVNGAGPSPFPGSGAAISSVGGTQTVSITGSGANAITLGSQGALGDSRIGGGQHQIVTAGAAGERGSITIVGPDANSRLAGFVSTPVGLGGTQTISTTGLLRVLGGRGSQASNFQSGVFHNGRGAQTVNAGRIELQGGSTGTNNGAFINSGGGGNPANVGDQFITVTGDIVIAAGAGGGASIAGGLPSTQQIIHAHNIDLSNAVGGTNSFASIRGGKQEIHATGDVTLRAFATNGTDGGVRIGGLSPNATDLDLYVGRDLILTGGSAADNNANIGSTGSAGVFNRIYIEAGRDVVLNSGSGSGARIGSGNTLGDGNIEIHAGRNIELNGIARATSIRTLGSVILEAASITEASNGSIIADSLTTTTSGATNLVGPNQLSRFSATSGGPLALVDAGSLQVTGVTTTNDTITLTTDSLTNSGVISNGGTGNITFNADAFNLAGGTVEGGSAAVILRPRTGTNSFGIEAAGATTLTNADIASINTSNFVVFGSSTGTIFTGNMTIGQNARVEGNGKSLAFSRSLTPSAEMITIGSQGVATTGDVIIGAGGGGIRSNGGTITGDEVQLRASNGIGTPSARVKTAANALALNNAGGGGVFVSELDNVTLRTISLNVGGVFNTASNTNNGSFSLISGGDVNVAGLVSSGGSMILDAAGNLKLEGNAVDTELRSFGGQAISAQSINLTAQNGRRVVIQNQGGLQELTARSGGMDLEVAGAAGVAQIVNISSPFFLGDQTINVAGQLNVLGGATGGSTNSGIFQNGTGLQKVTAAGITLQGASTGTNAGAGIRSQGDQLVDVSGDINLRGGNGGTNNNAFLSANPTTPGVVGKQTIYARDINMSNGVGGVDTSATITAGKQLIDVTGNVTLTSQGALLGTAPGGPGVRIGAPGGTPLGTDLTLLVDGNVTLNGGTVAENGASIGSSGAGVPPASNKITIEAGGNVILNAGTASGTGVRIGSGSSGTAGGNITILADGNIQLNGTQRSAAIRTLDNVTLEAASISQGTNGFILANTLTTRSTAGNTSLTGPNQVSSYNGTSGGDLSLRNTGALTVTGLNAGGDATLDNIGNVTVSGAWTAGGTSAIAAHSDIVLDAVLTSAHVVLSAEGGSITEVGAGAIIANTLTTQSGGSTTLAGENRVANYSGTSAADLFFFNRGALNVSGLSAASANLSNDGTVTLSGPWSTVGRTTLTASGPGSSLLETPGGFIQAGGGADLFAQGSIDLNGSNQITGTLSAFAMQGDISLTNIGDVNFTGSASFGGIDLVNTGVLDFSGFAGFGPAGQINLTNTGALNVRALSGSDTTVTSNGPMTVSGFWNSSTAAITTVGAGSDLTVTNFLQSSGPMNLDIEGALRVEARGLQGASLTSFGGQSITARSIEVTSRDGQFATIGNNNAGDQTITVSGGGIDIQSMSGGGFAFITNSGTAQTISASGGPGIAVQSVAGGGSAQINNFGSGNQTINVSGGGVEVQTLSGNGFAIVNNSGPGSQAITVSDGSGIDVRSLSSGGLAQLGNFGGAGQTITVSGGGGVEVQTLAPNSFASLFNGSGSQSINVSGGTGVAVRSGGGSAAIGNNGFGGQAINVAGGTGIDVRSNGGNASINSGFAQSIATDGDHLDVIGAGGNASISAAGNQTIAMTGAGPKRIMLGDHAAQGRSTISSNGNQTITGNADITLIGGSGPIADGSNATIFAGNPTRLQRIDAGTITLANSTLGGNNSFAGIQGANQIINATGNVTLTANASGGSLPGVRIGGIGGGPNSTPTNLTLNVGGDLILTGGTVAGNGVGIGSTAAPGQAFANNITIDAGGSVILNSGTVSGTAVRIGSSGTTGAAPGNISITAGDDIRLNGVADNAAIRTLDTVTLNAATISEAPRGFIVAGTLNTTTQGDQVLTGPNQVASFTAASDTGNVSLTNTAPVLTLGSMELPGTLTIDQTGTLSIPGTVSALSHAIEATGDVLVGSAGATNAALLSASDSISITTPGAIIVRGSDLTPLGSSEVVAAGAVNFSAGSVSLIGGSAPGSFAQITGHVPMHISVGSDISLAGGSGDGAFARILGYSDINLTVGGFTVGGFITLNAGTGVNSWARIQTASRDSVITLKFPNLASGGYFVNGIEGLLRDGHTGFLSGNGVAAPGHQLITIYGAP